MIIEENIEEVFNEILSFNTEEAIKYCEDGFKTTYDYDYVVLKAHGKLSLGEYEEAIALVEEALKNGCSRVIYANNIKGEALLELGLYVESRRVFEKVLDEEPGHYLANTFLLELDIREEFYQDAIRRAVNFIENYGDEPLEVADFYSAIGWTYLTDLNKPQIAKDSFEEAIKLNCNLERAFTGLGIYYALVKEYQRAIDMFKRAIELDQNDGENYFGLAICEKELGNFDNIENWLLQANALEPEDNRILMEYGYELVRQEREEEAIEVFKQILETNSNDNDIEKLIIDLEDLIYK